jgi:hypothetical protein
LILANKIGSELQIDWILNKELNCPFLKLFKPLEGVKINDSIPIGLFEGKLFKLHVYLKAMKYAKSFSRAELDAFKNNHDIKSYLDNYKTIFISSMDAFYGSTGDYSYLKPTDEIMEKVKKHTSTFSQNCIGLHIRRSDHAYATSNSKTEYFVAIMDKEIENNSDTTFFLATDSPEEEAFLKNKYTYRIITTPKILDRNSPKGIQDALADILCLSRTKKIYGCNMSSFSGAASYFGKVPIEFIGNDFK